MTINLMFNAIADHMPDITRWVPRAATCGWLNGIKHWQVDYTGKAPAAL
jgi:cholest-4-en-3-one 26-monooxygenase